MLKVSLFLLLLLPVTSTAQDKKTLDKKFKSLNESINHLITQYRKVAHELSECQDENQALRDVIWKLDEKRLYIDTVEIRRAADSSIDVVVLELNPRKQTQRK